MEDEGEEKKEGEPAKGGKKKKGVKFAGSVNKKIKVVKQSRGGKKMVTSIWGLHEWGIDLAETAKVMSKRFGTGAAACEIDYKGEKGQGILIQGDVTDRFEDFIEQDLASYSIDQECVYYEDGGNKKNRTMGGGKK